MKTTRLPLITVLVLSILIALPSYRFVVLGLPISFSDMLGQIKTNSLIFALHVGVALVIGGVQFFPGLRRNHKILHRWLGPSKKPRA